MLQLRVIKMSEQFTFKEQLKEVQRFTDKLEQAELFYYNDERHMLPHSKELLTSRSEHLRGNACEEFCFLINIGKITNLDLLAYVEPALNIIFKKMVVMLGSELLVETEHSEFYKYIKGKQNEGS